MSISALPLMLDLIIYTGATFRRQFRWLPDGHTPQDFTGWTALMLIGPAAGTATIELTVANGRVILGTDGLITVQIAATDTTTMTAGFFAYDLDIIDPTLVVTRFLRGRMQVVRDVGRAS